jgi:hypothetical protein
MQSNWDERAGTQDEWAIFALHAAAYGSFSSSGRCVT